MDASGADETLVDLIDTASDFVPAGLDDALTAPALEPLSLDLGDLLPDAAGEVVLMGAADVPFSIHAGEAVTATGIADAHVTMGGLDVTGLHFYSFESGITLYSPTDLAIDSPHTAG
ncbi:MAG TPA: hypothetical protein VGA60_06310 [Kiloniellales bacterium]|jgi:hypothetical protein